MQMIASGKYVNHIWTFYSNRALRIYPVYFVAATIALTATNLSELLTVQTPWLYLPIFTANTTLFGGDLLLFFGYHGRLLVPPAWSIGLELWFYLLVPFLARTSSGVLLVCCITSAVLAWHMEAAQSYSTYFLFPANCCLFGSGMLAYRSMVLVSEMPRKWQPFVRGLAIAGTALLILRPMIPGFRNYPLAQETVLVACLPFIFAESRSLAWDRAVGNLSYSVYLLHEPVMGWLGDKPTGIATLAITLPLALGVYFAIESPIDRWRQRRAAGPTFLPQPVSAA